MDFGTQAQAFAALLAHWQLERPNVIAHDFCGAALALARYAGERAEEPGAQPRG